MTTPPPTGTAGPLSAGTGVPLSAGSAGRTWSAGRVGGLMVAQAVNLVTVLAVVRIYPPAAYGGYAALFAIASVVAGVSALRLDLAVTTAGDRDAVVLGRVARRLNLAAAAAAIVVGLFWWASANQLTGSRAGQVAALGVVIAMFGLSNTLTYACVRAQRYGLVAASRLAVALVTAAGQIGLGLVWPTPTALLLAAGAGYAAGSLVLWQGCRAVSSAGSAGEVLRRHRGFITASAPAVLLNSLSLQLPVLITAGVLGAVAAADLALALRIGLVPLALCGQALLPILFGRIAGQIREAPADAIVTYDRALVWMAAAGAAGLTGLAVTVLLAAEVLLGPEWVGVGPVLLVLTPFLIAQFAVAPLSQTLNALGRNRDQLIWDAARLLGIGLAFTPVLLGRAEVSVSVTLFSAVMVVGYVLHVLLTRQALRSAAAAHGATPRFAVAERPHG